MLDASDRSNAEDSDASGAVASESLGNYETEQLINAISKIADLLRKCWGVAGADIISSNLARNEDGNTVLFNPIVPGKRVYAVFGFVLIDEFSNMLRALEQDIMILINDVAKVVHEEVYRWALADMGQCNRNLGSAFLMVFRIGDFETVHARKKRATEVVFSSQKKERNTKLRNRSSQTPTWRGRQRNQRQGRVTNNHDVDDTGAIQLSDLPGIQTFTDRALLSFLKSFAGLHRDRNLQNWKKDFRIGAGVEAFTVNCIYGMNAGWAVEGAVGSEYKIDATYLSPHVNMASRMMMAAKQFGVTIMMSQSVEEVLSKNAQTKLRHLDTVYVKGSRVPQRVYTYDARFAGVDFFLFERGPEQANMEAEGYTAAIWDTDQDLKSMRQHVTDEFMEVFKKGVDLYLEGEWKQAVKVLIEADDLMIRAVLEEGYVEYDIDDLEDKIYDRENKDEEAVRLREELGDGACRCLINFMERTDYIAPKDWHGVRQLTSK